MKKTKSLLLILLILMLTLCMMLISGCTLNKKTVSPDLRSTDSITFIPNDESCLSDASSSELSSLESFETKSQAGSASSVVSYKSSKSSSQTKKPDSSAPVSSAMSSFPLEQSSTATESRVIKYAYVTINAPDKTILDGKIALLDGDTAFSAVVRACNENEISVVYKKDPIIGSQYVKSIAGYAEKALSATSGWIYNVNSERPSKSADLYVLKENDKLVWEYIEKL